MAVSQACSSCGWEQSLREGPLDCCGGVSTSSQPWPATVIGGTGGGRGGRATGGVGRRGGGGGRAGGARDRGGMTLESCGTLATGSVYLSERRCRSAAAEWFCPYSLTRQNGSLSDTLVRGSVRPIASSSASRSKTARRGRCLSTRHLRPCRRLRRDTDDDISVHLPHGDNQYNFVLARFGSSAAISSFRLKKPSLCNATFTLNPELDCSICCQSLGSIGQGKTTRRFSRSVEATVDDARRRSGDGHLSEWETYRLRQRRQQQPQLRRRRLAGQTNRADPGGTFIILEAGNRDDESDRTLASPRFSQEDIVVNTTSLGSTDSNRVSLPTITEPVAEDLDIMRENLKTIVGERHPMLLSAADQIFSAGGKRLRPALVFLVSRATAELGGLDNLLPQHRRLAEITEMIHTASLVHDDVLDDSDVRRGAKTVHNLYGTRVAVLVGDFLFAQSSWYLANLNNLEVIKLISQVIADFANGEIQQAASLFDCNLSLEGYMEKSYFKTASLMAASCKSGAIFSGVSEYVRSQMFDYGKHLGLAFQVVDDILDFTQSTAQLGKPAGSDLATGNLTAPALFAMKREPQLQALIEAEFVEEASIQRAIELVARGGGIQDAQKLAESEGEKARHCLQCLPQTRVRQSLESLIDYVLERLY